MSGQGQTVHITASPEQTEALGARVGAAVPAGVVALFGGLGMGKTAFVRGMAAGRRLSAEVSSPTFALVHEYGGQPPLVHFDMYRVSGWDDLYSTGFFDYLDAGCLLAVEWSENIEAALPEDAVRVRFERLDDDTRRITIEGGERYGVYDTGA